MQQIVVAEGGKKISLLNFSTERAAILSRKVAQLSWSSFWGPEPAVLLKWGFYDAQQLFVMEAYVNCPTYHLGFVELEKMELGWHWAYHRAMFFQLAAGLKRSLPLETEGMIRWTTVEKRSSGKPSVWKQPFLNFISHIQQHQIIWSGMNSRKGLFDYLSFPLAASSLASAELSPTLLLKILLLY